MSSQKTYTADEIARKLAQTLPHWSYRDGAIRRLCKTHGWKGTLMVVNAIGHLAEAAWHHPDLSVSYNQVSIALSTHDANGITDLDFALAGKIEEFVFWQPGREDGPFEGTPSDEAHAYLKYDP